MEEKKISFCYKASFNVMNHMSGRRKKRGDLTKKGKKKNAGCARQVDLEKEGKSSYPAERRGEEGKIAERG